MPLARLAVACLVAVLLPLTAPQTSARTSAQQPGGQDRPAAPSISTTASRTPGSNGAYETESGQKFTVRVKAGESSDQLLSLSLQGATSADAKWRTLRTVKPSERKPLPSAVVTLTSHAFGWRDFRAVARYVSGSVRSATIRVTMFDWVPTEFVTLSSSGTTTADGPFTARGVTQRGWHAVPSSSGSTGESWYTAYDVPLCRAFRGELLLQDASEQDAVATFELVADGSDGEPLTTSVTKTATQDVRLDFHDASTFSIYAYDFYAASGQPSPDVLPGIAGSEFLCSAS